MIKNFTEVTQTGFRGSLLYWSRIFLILIPFIYIIYQIYWILLTANIFWLKSVGPSLLIANIFSVITSIASIILSFLSKRSPNPTIKEIFRFQLFIFVTVIALFIGFILLGLSSYTNSSIYLGDIEDYIERYSSTQLVTDFVASHPSERSIILYVNRRTDTVSVNATFIIVWLIFLAVFITTNDDKFTDYIISQCKDEPLIESDNTEYENQHTYKPAVVGGKNEMVNVKRETV